jgi:hypothetical protein
MGVIWTVTGLASTIGNDFFLLISVNVIPSDPEAIT